MKIVDRRRAFALVVSAVLVLVFIGGARPSGQAAVPNFDLEVSGAAAKGQANAPLTVVEFSEFECPFCGRYSRDTYPLIERDYVNTGKIRYVFRHLPIERIHPKALKASEAAQCAHAQGKFWEMHDRLFANQRTIASPDLIAHAHALGLNMPAFERCLAGQTTARVKQDLAEGLRAGITGTPAFFIGIVTKEGKLKVLRKLVGAKPYATFKTTLDGLLAQSATK